MCQPLVDSIWWLLFLEAMFSTVWGISFTKGHGHFSYLAGITFLALQAVLSLDECSCSLVRKPHAKTSKSYNSGSRHSKYIATLHRKNYNYLNDFVSWQITMIVFVNKLFKSRFKPTVYSNSWTKEIAWPISHCSHSYYLWQKCDGMKQQPTYTRTAT